MNLDLATYNAFLHEFYEEGVEQQFKRQTVFLDEVVMPRMGGPKNIRGKYAVIGVEGMSLGGVGTRDEDEDLPTPEPGIYRQLQVALKYFYFAARVTGPTLILSEGADGAFADAETRELLMKTNAFLMNINRNLQHTSTGVLCRVDATPAISGTTFAVDRAGNVGSAGSKETDTNGAKFLTPNMNIEIWSAETGGSLVGTFRVTGVTAGSGTSTSARITVDTVPGVTGSEWVFLEGSRGKDAVGLGDILSATSTLYGLSPSSTAANYLAEWLATIHTGATAGTLEALTRHRIANVMTDAEMNTGIPIDFIVTDRSGGLTYADMCARTRIQVNVMKLSEGWSGFDFDGRVPIISDLWAPPYRMRGIPTSVLNPYEGLRPGFIKTGGDVLKQVGRRDTYEAQYRWYMQFGCRFRRAVWELQDIQYL